MPADTGTWYRWEGDDLLVSLRVQPRAKRDELGEPVGDQLKVRITAPPVDGRANTHLCRFLARTFGVPPTRVEIVAGEQARAKRLRIRGPSRLPAPIQPPGAASD
jgi:uncharacterized protein (TIGR00251 family)